MLRSMGLNDLSILSGMVLRAAERANRISLTSSIYWLRISKSRI